MKTFLFVCMSTLIIFGSGCNDAALKDCQDSNQQLQTQVENLQKQLEASNTMVAKKNDEIEKMRAANIEMQNKAMEGITTMLEKQSAKDQERTAQLKEAQQKIADLEKALEAAKSQN